MSIHDIPDFVEVGEYSPGKEYFVIRDDEGDEVALDYEDMHQMCAWFMQQHEAREEDAS